MTNWLSTNQAAAALGIAPCTLKRKRDDDGGFLESETHYRYKTPAANSAILWDVDAIRVLFHNRAITARTEKAQRKTKSPLGKKALEIISEIQQETTNEQI